MPYAQSYTAGWQRALNRSTAFEIRYVGTRFLQSFVDYNFNEINTKENGFLDEFRMAQANLQANIEPGPGRVVSAGSRRPAARTTSPTPVRPERRRCRSSSGAYNAVSKANAGNPARVYRHELDQYDLPRVPRPVQSEPRRVRQHQHDERSDRKQHVPCRT